MICEYQKLPPRVHDHTGRRYGALTAVRFIGYGDDRKIVWEFVCECGKHKDIRIGCVTSGHTLSCGCRGNRRAHTESPTYRGCGDISGNFWSSLRANAKARNLVVSLTIEDGWSLFVSQNRKCSLSGVDLKFSDTMLLRNGNASLDRIDSSKGYEIGNVQWVDKHINLAKRKLSDADFISLCQRVVDYNRSKYVA